MQPIDHFMWGYQEHFRISFQSLRPSLTESENLTVGDSRLARIW